MRDKCFMNAEDGEVECKDRVEEYKDCMRGSVPSRGGLPSRELDPNPPGDRGRSLKES